MPTATKPAVSADLRNQIIQDAQNLPDLVARAEVLDPALADALKGQATTISATPLGALVAAGIAWVVARYGLGWSDSFQDLVAGGAILAGGYAVHWWQARKAPAPVFTPAPAPAPAPATPPTT